MEKLRVLKRLAVGLVCTLSTLSSLLWVNPAESNVVTPPIRANRAGKNLNSFNLLRPIPYNIAVCTEVIPAKVDADGTISINDVVRWIPWYVDGSGTVRSFDPGFVHISQMTGTSRYRIFSSSSPYPSGIYLDVVMSCDSTLVELPIPTDVDSIWSFGTTVNGSDGTICGYGVVQAW